MVRPKCVYCGKPLPAQLLEAVASSAQKAIQELERQLPSEADAAAPPTASGSRRLLIVLDLRRADAAALQGALGVSAFEAGQRLRKGGLQLHRIAAESEARAEAERIGGHGLATVLLDEQPLLSEPLVASGGALEQQRLRARTPAGRLELTSDQLLLVVKGPIHREHQADSTNLKRIKSATPSPGYRFHLHRRSDARPLELDPGAFEFEVGAGNGVGIENQGFRQCAHAGQLVGHRDAARGHREPDLLAGRARIVAVDGHDARARPRRSNQVQRTAYGGAERGASSRRGSFLALASCARNSVKI